MTENELKNITFGEWLDYWYDVYKKPNVAKNTLRNIEQMIRLHTPTWLKDMRLVDITLLDIDRALSELKASRTTTYARQTWNNAFSKAVKLGILSRNVVSSSDNIRYRKKKSKALSKNEIEQFLLSIKGTRSEWAFLFAIHSGARRAEIASLLWTDIDYDDKSIHIRGTKTEASDRHIPLTKDLRCVLECQRLQTESEIGTRFESKHPEKVFDYNANYLSHVFKKHCPKHHLHELRHTYITLCAECNMNVNVCQQLVGHSSPQITLNIYTHVLDDFKRKESSKFSLFPTPKTAE